MDDYDQASMGRLLNSELSSRMSLSWTNPNGNQYTATAGPADQSRGTWCRDVTIEALIAGKQTTATATACDRGGRWVY